jgi:hypothetical protein
MYPCYLYNYNVLYHILTTDLSFLLLGGVVGEPRVVTPENGRRGRDDLVDREEGGALVLGDGRRGVITEV